MPGEHRRAVEYADAVDIDLGNGRETVNLQHDLLVILRGREIELTAEPPVIGIERM